MPLTIKSQGLFLYIYKLCVYDFGGTGVDVVHSLHPFELVLGFQLFGDVFGFCHLLDKDVEHLLSLGVDFGEVLVEFALG